MCNGDNTVLLFLFHISFSATEQIMVVSIMLKTKLKKYEVGEVMETRLETTLNSVYLPVPPVHLSVCHQFNDCHGNFIKGQN